MMMMMLHFFGSLIIRSRSYHSRFCCHTQRTNILCYFSCFNCRSALSKSEMSSNSRSGLFLSGALATGITVVIGYQLYRKLYPKDLKKNMKQIIFVIGGPGSGKGTQCSLIHEKYGHSHISAGDLLRAERQKGGELGDMINKIIKDGKIVPSEITTTLLLNAIQECDNNKFLIDGFPRGSPNLAAWNDLVPNNVDVPFLLLLQCPDDVMTARLLERGKTSGRSDDNAETIQKRLATDAAITQPVIDYFKSIGKLRVVDANRPVNDVFSDVKIHFDNANAH